MKKKKKTWNRLVENIFSYFHKCFNSLPNDKISDQSKLKAFADDKIDVVEMMISLLDRVENTAGKRENAGYQHFLLFPQWKTAFFLRVDKSRDGVVKNTKGYNIKS